MVTIQPDNYELRTNEVKTSPSEGVKKTAKTIVDGGAKNLKDGDVTEIKQSQVEVDEEAVAESQRKQMNKALEARENAELEFYKDDLRAAIASGKSTDAADAMKKIAEIESKRLHSLRLDTNTENLLNLIFMASNGEDVSEGLESLTPNEKRIYRETMKTLSKISEENKAEIPDSFYIFCIKKSRGDYNAYTPQEARDLVERRMQVESLKDAPNILRILTPIIREPSEALVKSVNKAKANRADSLRQATMELTDGYDAKTGTWRKVK